MKATHSSILPIVSLLASTALVGEVFANACATTSPESTSGVVGGSGGCEAWGMWGCSVGGGNGTCTASSGGQSFTVQSTKNLDGTVDWHLTTVSEGFAGLDAAVWIGQRQGQNSPHLWSYDVTSATGMDCDNPPKQIYFCSDGNNEFVQIDTENTDTPDVGAACINTETGALTTSVFGVDLDVTDVSPYQGDTTIVVAKSNRKCGNLDLGQPACIASNETFQIIDPNNQVWEPDPYFGFVDPATGEITLENVCVAGLPVKNAEPLPDDDPAFQARPQCDPDETVDNGPNTDSLDVCDDRLKGVIREEFSAGFEGSGYVRGGGSNRYY